MEDGHSLRAVRALFEMRSPGDAVKRAIMS
jgi:hypothetical protein